MTNKEIKRHSARIGKKFSDEVEEIRKERMKRGLDKKKRSVGFLTNVITHHDSWKDIKEDTINLDMDGKKYE